MWCLGRNSIKSHQSNSCFSSLVIFWLHSLPSSFVKMSLHPWDTTMWHLWQAELYRRSARKRHTAICLTACVALFVSVVKLVSTCAAASAHLANVRVLERHNWGWNKDLNLLHTIFRHGCLSPVRRHAQMYWFSRFYHREESMHVASD